MGVIYRPPNTNVSLFNDQLTCILNKIKPANNKIYLVGDYNINLLNTDAHIPTSDFIELMYSSTLFPLICKPTRVQNNSATLIDNIFNNIKDNISTFNGILVSDISDHYPIFHIDYSSHVNTVEQHSFKRIFTKSSIDKFSNEMQTFDWSDVMNCNNAQNAFTKFHTSTCATFEKHFPIKKITRTYKNKKAWLTLGIKHSIKVKNKLFLKYKKDSSQENASKYKGYRNKLNTIVRKAERSHYEMVFEKYKSNLKKTWSVIKDVINKKKSNGYPRFFKINEQMCENKDVIAHSFNQYFANIGHNLAALIPPSTIDPVSYISQTIDETLYLNPVTEDELKKLICNIKKSGSGWDNIGGNVIKQTHVSFITPLTHVFNLSISQGIFPSELKVAKVIPLYKTGDNTLFVNYRPISILSIFSKYLEKLMFTRLIQFIEKHKIFHSMQFGFRKEHSTGLALTILVDRITEALDNGNYACGIFLDFSKAFDTVDHSILFQKLSCYGIRGLAHDWLVSYLTDRKQFVSFDGTSSNLTELQCGVPQGSVLGPLLFLLYINDIANVSKLFYMILFADDTSALLSGRNISVLENMINDELINVVKWLDCNKLSLNVSKSHFIMFTTKKHLNQDVNIVLNNQRLTKLESTKFLGVYVDCKLNWKNHIQYLKGKIARGIGILKLCRKYFTKSTLVTLYYSFIYPHLFYNLEVWGAACCTHLSCLEKLQKRCIRIITSSRWDAHTAGLFKTLQILPLSQLYSLKLLVFLYKYLNGNLSSLFSNYFIRNNEMHNYPTRSGNLFSVPKANTDLRKRTLRYSAINIYNSLYSTIDFSVRISSFKRKIKVYFLNL